MTHIGKAVRDARKKQEMTVSELAARLKKTPGYVSRIEIRGEKPSPDLVLRIADVLGLKPEKLATLAKQDMLEAAEQENDRRFEEAFVLFRRTK